MRFFTVFVCFFIVMLPVNEVDRDMDSGIENDWDTDYLMIDFYPTYGYPDGGEWVIPVKMYVYRQRRMVEGLLVSMFSRRRPMTEQERVILRTRIRAFASDSKSRQRVKISFDDDPENELFTILDDNGRELRSDLHGVIEGEIRVPVERADELLQAQGSVDGWLGVTAETGRYSGVGNIRLIGPEGVSVISDIDDTIKISEMPAGSRTVVRNAFYKEYVAAPGMADMYRQWEDKPFHYVSGTPRQFFRPLVEFLHSDEAGFPRGSYHMRHVRRNLLSRNTWRDLEQMIRGGDHTHRLKLDRITTIMEHFPDREFILIGDSGEFDPEIFRDAAAEYPGRVREIIIRDVANDRELNPERLEGMRVLEL